jgi:hypothetical protein
LSGWPSWEGTIDFGKPARIAPLLLACVTCAGAWDVFVSGSQGYTHYEAGDLNRVLVLMEKTTAAKGFNPYTVSQFDGHPQKALVLGVELGHWTLGVETEFWVETFEQTEVPFDLQEAERTYRITCDTLRSSGFKSDRPYGCVDAKEIFNFLPITAQVSYGRDLGRFLRMSAGYGVGVMAGSAFIDLNADYFGDVKVSNDPNAHSDHIKLEIWPGVNAVHKVFADAEYKPWSFFGLDLRFGWRYCNMPGFNIKSQEGKSQIFSKVFPEAKEGANLYIRSFSSTSAVDQIYLGTEASARDKAAQDGSQFHLVEGDFTGWFAALKLNLYWRGI